MGCQPFVVHPGKLCEEEQEDCRPGVAVRLRSQAYKVFNHLVETKLIQFN